MIELLNSPLVASLSFPSALHVRCIQPAEIDVIVMYRVNQELNVIANDG